MALDSIIIIMSHAVIQVDRSDARLFAWTRALRVQRMISWPLILSDSLAFFSYCFLSF